ncbi:MAG TPA: copper resistance protein CopC [Intrasporangiaceae bacterium]|nr:copper resistance protein CopC [Intrasporangiaceae bacterium]
MSAPAPRPPRLRAVVTAVIALLVVAAMVLPAAFGHAQLVSSSPQEGESLPTADEVVLTFNEPISPDFVQTLAKGPDGDLEVGDAVVEENVLTQAISPTASGEHSFTYRVVSADGHPISGTITFTLTEVAGAPAQPTGEDSDAGTDAPATDTSTDENTTDGDSTDDATTDEVTSEVSTEPDTTESTGGFGIPLWMIVIGGIVVVAGLLYRLFRRRPEH